LPCKSRRCPHPFLAAYAGLRLELNKGRYWSNSGLDFAANDAKQRCYVGFDRGTGGEALDPVVTTAVVSGSGETNLEDPSGNTNFNAQNLVAATGDYWGVMALTLDEHGYRWHFQSALRNNGQWPAVAPTGVYSDTGEGACHGLSDDR
jgi:hypothetical protein